MSKYVKKYFYSILSKYLALYVRSKDILLDINPTNFVIGQKFTNYFYYFTDTYDKRKIVPHHKIWKESYDKPDYILLNGNVQYERDIQKFLIKIKKICKPSTRIVLIYYSGLWKPFVQLFTFLGMRDKTPEQNWVTHEDVENLLRLSDYELIKRESKVLLPVYIPIISYLLNRFIAPLFFFRLFSFLNIAIAKPVIKAEEIAKSVTVVIPARNEAGNIENLLLRIPKMGPDDEVIFIEGNSTDNTWDVIREVQEKFKNLYNIKIDKQQGKGKGDAVRKGFSLATKDILMILDADISVQPEDLIKFYEAIISDKGEFINGSRLIYPMDKKAMRFFNILGNKFFALGFSFVIGQKFKDTLCGTKVLTRNNYMRIAKNRSFFGDFDPFGDFDLILGAARMGLKIVEVPITYKERTYGSTNIQRWKHGMILFKMLVFAALKIKFI